MQGIFTFEDIRSYCRSIYGDKNLLIIPNAYPLALGSIADGAVVNSQVQIRANADFILLSVSFTGDPASQILLTDSASGEQFTSRPVFAQDYTCLDASTPGVARDLPYPRFIAGNSSITAQVVGDNATVADVYLTMLGVDVYELGA